MRAFALVITLVVACFVFAAITGLPAAGLAAIVAIPFVLAAFNPGRRKN